MSLNSQVFLAARAILAADSGKYSDEEVAQAQKLVAEAAAPVIGQTYIVRTVTIFSAGVVIDVNDDFIVLADAFSISDSGDTTKFMDAKAAWAGGESFPANNIVYVARGAIVEITNCAANKPR